MKIGIRIKITEETEEFSHYLFDIYDVQEFNEKQYPNKFNEYLESLKQKTFILASGDISE